MNRLVPVQERTGEPVSAKSDGTMMIRSLQDKALECPVIDLALYDRDLEWEQKVHRLDDGTANVVCFETAVPSAQLSQPHVSGRSHNEKKSQSDPDPEIELIVVPEQAQCEGTSSNRDPVTWHRLLQENQWEALKDDISQHLRSKRLVLDTHLMTAESSSSSIHIAASSAPPEVTLQLLEVMMKNPSPDVSSIERTRNFCLCGDADENTPLHLACLSLSADQGGRMDFAVIKNLLLVAHDVLRFVNNEGDTPIHVLLASEAYRRGVGDENTAEEAICTLLLAAPEVLMIQNNRGLTPLHVALANRCCSPVLFRIISHSIAAFDIADSKGMKPLHYAAMHGAPLPCFELMVECLPESLCHTTTTEGDTPLHYMIANLDSLMEYNGEHTSKSGKTKPRNKDTPSYIEQITRLLVGSECQAGSPLWTKNDEGYSPLHCCAMFNFPPNLIEVAFETVSPYVQAKALATVTDEGATPLHTALLELSMRRPRHRQLTKSQRSSLKRTVGLFATPFTCSVRDVHGRTPLITAVYNRRPALTVVASLLKASPESASVEDNEGYLPLHHSVRHRTVNEQVLRALLKVHLPAVEHQSKNGNTPLHIACKHCKTDSVVAILIDAKPEVLQIKNSKGERPIDKLVPRG